jgi:ABC-type branched-subunit amino acid transport system substrate-binding protein
LYGAQAFVAYQNSLGGVDGRKLTLLSGDDGFDAGQNRAQTLSILPKVLGFVGSASLYDDAAVPEMEQANVPDVGLAIAPARQNSPVNFSPATQRTGAITGPWELLKQEFPDAVDHVGAIYGAIPSSKESYEGIKAAAESVGFKFVYERGIQPTETDFTADVVRMRQEGVKLVYTGNDAATNARIAQAMAAQGFKPEAYVAYVSYDAKYIPLAGKAAEGTLNITNYAMFLGEDAATVPEVALFDNWVKKVKPGWVPDTFTVYGWASTRLFVQALEAAGKNPTRATVVDALKKIHNFNSNGLLPPSDPAGKGPATCYIMTTVQNGQWQRWHSPSGFLCNGTFHFISGGT